MDFEQKYLDEFAYLKDKAYLNCCSVSMPPKRTMDFTAHFEQEYADHMGELCFGPYGERRDRVREMIADMIGAEKDEIVLTHNTTDGDCLLMHALDLKPGDSVVVTNFDYPAVILGWYQLQKKGIRVITVEAQNGCVTAESMIEAIDETTKVVSVSWVQYMSGYKIDLEKLGQACHDKNVILQVDGIQGLGRNTVDVKKCHIGIFSSGFFKGMLGLLGAAFYYVDPDLLPRLTPCVWADDNMDCDETELPFMDLSGGLPYRPGTDKLAAGSLNNIGILASGESISLLAEIGIDRIQNHVLDLEQYARKKLRAEVPALTLLGSDDPAFESGTAAGNFPVEKADVLEEALKARGVYATVRKARGKGFLRFAIHFYNTKEHLDRMTAVLCEVL